MSALPCYRQLTTAKPIADARNINESMIIAEARRHPTRRWKITSDCIRSHQKKYGPAV
jgi:hypothetical protein